VLRRERKEGIEEGVREEEAKEWTTHVFRKM
jgi:hypothetical protein